MGENCADVCVCALVRGWVVGTCVRAYVSKVLYDYVVCCTDVVRILRHTPQTVGTCMTSNILSTLAYPLIQLVGL